MTGVAADLPLHVAPDSSSPISIPSLWRTWVRVRGITGEFAQVAIETWDDLGRVPATRSVSAEGFVLASALNPSSASRVPRRRSSRCPGTLGNLRREPVHLPMLLGSTRRSWIDRGAFTLGRAGSSAVPPVNLKKSCRKAGTPTSAR